MEKWGRERGEGHNTIEKDEKVEMDSKKNI